MAMLTRTAILKAQQSGVSRSEAGQHRQPDDWTAVRPHLASSVLSKTGAVGLERDLVN